MKEDIGTDSEPRPDHNNSCTNVNGHETQQTASCKIEYESDPEHGTNQSSKSKRKKKLIAFIGNLPYGCTEERLRAFLKMDDSIIQVRLPRNPSNKSRTQGYAFCEFSDHLAFRKCLLLHHSKFEGRRINVELTAGGGGNSQHRKKKIAMNNDRANKWRAKRTQKMEEQLKKGDGKLQQGANTKPAAN